MTTTETRLIDGIDPSVWAAYNRNPDDWTLLDIMTDMALENGREDLADFFRWVRIKQRHPAPVLESWVWASPAESRVPDRLDNEDWEYCSSGQVPANALWRLHYWWKSLTPERREQIWRWTPEGLSN
jgi:hypothetical protein